MFLSRLKGQNYYVTSGRSLNLSRLIPSPVKWLGVGEAYN